jgi:hypothetical protein
VNLDRRYALKRGLVLIGAAFGLGTASKVVVATGESNAGGLASERLPASIKLYGRRWRLTSQKLRSGELPPEGERMLARGELLDGPRGRKVGEFYATYYRLNAHGRVGPDEAGSLQLHTFNLPGGSIAGSGTAKAGIGAEDHFAIIGGTGRYSGARGSYIARQSYLELGGDGTAVFTLTLI